MADDGGAGRARAAAELLFLRRLPPVIGLIVLLVVCAGCVVLGVQSLAIQHHYANQGDGGRLASLLAHGSSAATAWEGWAAALFFLVALMWLRRVPPEPPAGRRPIEELTAGQLRAGLLREYTVVRIGLVILCAVSVLDAARAARYVVASASGDSVASASLAATLIEACGLVVATVILALWAGSFRQQLDRMGALR